MEDQLLETRNARKALFEFDKLGEHGVEIDLELGRDDKTFSFEVNESWPAFEYWESALLASQQQQLLDFYLLDRTFLDAVYEILSGSHIHRVLLSILRPLSIAQ